MDEAAIKQLLESERKRSVELAILVSSLEKASLEKKELIIRDIGNKVLRSCGDGNGITGFPLLLDWLFPFKDKTTQAADEKHFKPEEVGTSPQELYSIASILVKSYMSMTYRIQVAYQIDLAAKGYTGEEADSLGFYLSRKETYFLWYKTPNSKMRRFATIFDILDVKAEDIGMQSEVIHDEIARFYQIWLQYLQRREWDSLVKHIISDRWSDHGEIGLLINRLTPIEVDQEISIMLKPDGAPINKEAQETITKRFGMLFDGNNLRRLEYETDSSDDSVRKRQLRFICHGGRLNPAPHPIFSSLLWGAEIT